MNLESLSLICALEFHMCDGTAPDYLYKIKKNDPPRKDFCDLSYNTQVIPNILWNLNSDFARIRNINMIK